MAILPSQIHWVTARHFNYINLSNYMYITYLDQRSFFYPAAKHWNQLGNQIKHYPPLSLLNLVRENSPFFHENRMELNLSKTWEMVLKGRRPSRYPIHYLLSEGSLNLSYWVSPSIKILVTGTLKLICCYTKLAPGYTS